MAFSTHDIKYLCMLKSQGILRGNVLTLGRTRIMAQPWEVQQCLNDSNVLMSDDERRRVLPEVMCFADELLKHLGAEKVEAIDISDYEGACYVADLGIPFPDELIEKFDLVIDAGTLEHVYDFPTGIENVMTATKLGGSIVILTHTNNFAGHGFYQFSPELFFCLFDEKNGFEVGEMFLHEDRRNSPWFITKHPEDTGARVELCNSRPTFLKVAATRKTIQNCRNLSPIQFDWADSWADVGGAPPRRRWAALRAWLETNFPRTFHRYQRWRIDRSRSKGLRSSSYRRMPR